MIHRQTQILGGTRSGGIYDEIDKAGRNTPLEHASTSELDGASDFSPFQTQQFYDGKSKICHAVVGARKIQRERQQFFFFKLLRRCIRLCQGRC
jgi:hypothetical protein